MIHRRPRKGTRLSLALSLALPFAYLVNPLTAGTSLATNPVVTTLAALDTTTNTTGPAHPGDTIQYTATITDQSGNPDLSSVVFTNQPDSNTTFVPNSLQSSPIALNDSYTALGNVPISVPANAGVLANDSDPDGDALTISAYDTSSAHGGTVSMTTSGANAGSF